MRFRVFGLILLIMGIFSLNLLSVAAQSTIVVNSSADNTTVGDGECTLREAITNANNNSDSTGGDCAAGSGTDTIEFNIAGVGPHTIVPSSPFPAINNPIILDGLTQAGADCKTGLMIVISGTAIPSSAGLNVIPGASGSMVRGLVINNFSNGFGLLLDDSDNNIIQCNFIGTNATGTLAQANSVGLTLAFSSAHNLIGTDGDGTNDGNEGNLISGNSLGSWFFVDVNYNTFAGNKVGTDITGTLDLGNSSEGVYMQINSNHNIIGTNGDGIGDALEGNLVSGNNRIAIRLLDGDDNIIAGNLIGTDISGTNILPNNAGIFVQRSSMRNIIGTNGDGLSDELEGNLISGNVIGINITSDGSNTDNIIAGNLIGTDISGTLDLGNTDKGITIQSGNNRIGTDGDGLSDVLERNIVSGNDDSGIAADSALPTNIVIAGNYIGTDISGTMDLGNGSYGIEFSGGVTNSIIGTNGDGSGDALEGNLISGNGAAGIRIFSIAPNNIVAGNRVGTNRSGRQDIPNAIGILLESNNNQIGTDGDGVSDALEGNLISGNTGDGIQITGATAINNTVAGNIIGLNSGETAALANGGNGIHLLNSASNNTIGGTSRRRGNSIGGNAAAGVLIEGTNSTDNTIQYNYIGTNASIANLANGTNGIEISATGTGLTSVSNNWIFYHPTTGILLSNAADLGVAGISENNCLYQNTAGLNNTTGLSLFFENNWWGHRTGPSGVGTGNGDTVSADVDYQSFLRTAPNGCPTIINPSVSVSGVSVFDPAISKIGFLVPGQTGLVGEELEWIVTVSNTSSVAGTNVTIRFC